MPIEETGRSIAERIASGARATFAFLTYNLSWLSWLSVAVLVAVLLLLVTDFQPTRLLGWLVGPSGTIYVSSPGVYTRERLVNDRNDQDFWLREQLHLLDKDQIGFSTVAKSEIGVWLGRKEKTDGGQLPAAPVVDPASSASAATAIAKKKEEDGRPRPILSFLDTYAIRAAARDSVRQSILENLLDDRHDLTGNSVYGLKFDTTVYPGRYTFGRAFVRLSITPGQSELISEKPDPDNRFPDLPYHLRSFYDSSYSEIANNPNNPNYNSFSLYTQWLSNVRWRLNSHFLQIAETKCLCNQPQCIAPTPGWRQEIISTVNTILAIDGAKIRDGKVSLGNVSSQGVALPKPWENFLAITVNTPISTTVNTPIDGGCSNPPEFDVNPVSDTIQLRPKSEQSAEVQKEFQLVDEVDEEEAAYVVVPNSGDINQSFSLFWPHYRNIPSIARYVKSINKMLTYCTDNVGKEACTKYITIPSGYFNFIEKVIKPDMYAYSLFPRLEAASVLSGRTHSEGLNYSLGDADPGSTVGLKGTNSVDYASLEATAVGFTDSQSTKAIDFGWMIDVGPKGAPFQKSQFALISVPAWTSRLTVTVHTGWLGSSSEENSSPPYSYTVPIPPDYEAFDSFIGGEEAVRRPQINDELMDDSIELVACRKASILIPGLRLWRSAMVTVGSERADRITVLPNMRGIIAEFTNLSRPVKPGPATLRVWTSEGVDTQPRKVRISLPGNIAECDGKVYAPQPQPPPPPPPADVESDKRTDRSVVN